MQFHKQLLSPSKKTVFGLLGVLIIGAVFFPGAAQAGILENVVYNLVTNFFGWLVWAGGMLLNFAINEYVVGFGKTYATSGLGNTIDSLWVVVRDIFNLTFIFGLVFIGLRMIFNSGDSSTKKMLISLVMAALLVNFSLFITKFVIDFSNIAATQFVAGFEVKNGKVDVSGAFMGTMGLTGLFNWSTDAGFKMGSTGEGSSWGYIFGTMILFLVAAFVFLGGGILLMIRFVVLNLYMVLSPLMFLGWVFPAAASVTSSYWKGFLGQAFFAPAYVLMLYLAVRILTTFSTTGGSGSTLSTVFSQSANANFSTSFPPFVLSSIFLIAALIIAKKMGAIGASGVVAFGNSMTGKVRGYAQRTAGSATFGAAAKAGQYTAGYGARRLTNSKTMQAWGTKNAAGRALLRSTNAVADSSFDARRVGGMGKTFGIGEGVKGGFDSRVKEKAKVEQDYAKNVLQETQVYSVDANGKKVFASQAMEDEFKKRQQEKLAKNDKYKGGAARQVTEQAKINAVVAAQAVKQQEKAQAETEVAQLEQAVAADPNTVNKNALATKKSALTVIEQNLAALKAEELGIKTVIGEINKEQETITKSIAGSIESSIKYQNQLAYIEERQRNATGLINKTRMLANAAGGTFVATALAGPLVGAVGLATVPGLQAMNYSGQNSVDELRKTYGQDGTKMDKKKKDDEGWKNLSEKLKESGNMPAAPESPAPATT